MSMIVLSPAVPAQAAARDVARQQEVARVRRLAAAPDRLSDDALVEAVSAADQCGADDALEVLSAALLFRLDAYQMEAAVGAEETIAAEADDDSREYID